MSTFQAAASGGGVSRPHAYVHNMRSMAHTSSPGNVGIFSTQQDSVLRDDLETLWRSLKKKEYTMEAIDSVNAFSGGSDSFGMRIDSPTLRVCEDGNHDANAAALDSYRLHGSGARWFFARRNAGHDMKVDAKLKVAMDDVCTTAERGAEGSIIEGQSRDIRPVRRMLNYVFLRWSLREEAPIVLHARGLASGSVFTLCENGDVVLENEIDPSFALKTLRKRSALLVTWLETPGVSTLHHPTGCHLLLKVFFTTNQYRSDILSRNDAHVASMDGSTTTTGSINGSATAIVRLHA